MRKFYSWVVRNPKKLLVFFIVLAIAGAITRNMVAVNYNMKDYLPEGSPSTRSLDVMEQEFDGGIPNARVMVKNVSIAEALDYKEQLKNCPGVTDVLWLDDAVSIYQPLEMADSDTVEAYYKENNALFTVTVAEDDKVATIDRIRNIIGEENAMCGDAVSTAIATTGTVSEISKIASFAVLAVFLILLVTTTSWAEPFIILAGLGVAIMINSGSNLIFGEISFVTNAAGSVLQLAVSLDYSVFLLHRYEECLTESDSRKGAMVDALCKSTSSIASSGLTTVIGFLALIFMRFGIGPDLGLALAKSVAISLITVFIFMLALILIAYPLIEKTHHRSFMPEFNKFSKVVRRIMIPLAGIFVIAAVPSYLASNSNSYYYGSSHIYGPKTQLGKDTAAIEAIFGKNDTYVVLVPKGDSTTEQKLSDALHEIPEITGIISYVDTVGAAIPKEYLDEDMLAQLVSEHYSRMVLSVETDYEGKATFDLVERIRATANEYYPDTYYLAGEGVSTYDLMDTITADTLKVNLIAIGAVFIVLLLTMKSLSLPVILVFAIEAAIWINMGIPYFMDATVQYIAYLIISSVQLGATVDYAILFTDRYWENRQTMQKKRAIEETISAVTVSVLTSGTVLSLVGFLLHFISTHGILSQLGLYLGRVTLLSMTSVFFVLPGLLYLFDGVIRHTTLKLEFFNPGKEKTSHKMYKKILPALLSASLVLTTLTPAFAAETPSEKEEVIYVNLDTAGKIKDLYAVNIFGSGNITDYGDYSAVEILNTTDQITQNDEKITFSTDADRVYYKGTIKKQEIPWNIAIHYYMDGKEYSANEIAGKSGALKITVNITQNTNCPGDFFEGYALQATVTLDTKQCKNIIAEDATIANVGSSKQLAYTILPNKGADFTITADVTDFEMDGMSINCIPLNLNVEVDDEELMEQVTDLLDAIAELDDGASDLRDGASDLSDGGSTLHDGVSDLKDGASDLDKGIRDLSQGITQIQTALNTLNKQSAALTNGSGEFKKALTQLQTALNSMSVTSQDLSDLRSASSEIKKGMEDLAAGITALEQNTGFAAYDALMKQNGLDVKQLRQKNASAISSLQTSITQLEQQLSAMEAAGADTTALEAQITQLKNTISLLQANNASIQGTETYLNTIHQNVSELQKGAAALKTSYTAFDAKIGELVTALGGLAYQMGTLTSAVNTLVTEYETLDTGITSYTAGVAQIVAGHKKLTNGTRQLVTGSSALKSGSDDLYNGTSELLDGITELSDGTGELKDGTTEMREETNGMDTEISDKIDDMLSEITGDDIEITSFIDERNENIKSVQFVIQTERIQAEETDDAVQEDAAPLTFWQKLLKLFGSD